MAPRLWGTAHPNGSTTRTSFCEQRPTRREAADTCLLGRFSGAPDVGTDPERRFTGQLQLLVTLRRSPASELRVSGPVEKIFGTQQSLGHSALPQYMVPDRVKRPRGVGGESGSASAAGGGRGGGGPSELDAAPRQAARATNGAGGSLVRGNGMESGGRAANRSEARKTQSATSERLRPRRKASSERVGKRSGRGRCGPRPSAIRLRRPT